MAQPDVTAGVPVGGLGAMGYMTDMQAAETGAQKPGGEEGEEEEKDEGFWTQKKLEYIEAIKMYGTGGEGAKKLHIALVLSALQKQEAGEELSEAEKEALAMAEGYKEQWVQSTLESATAKTIKKEEEGAAPTEEGEAPEPTAADEALESVSSAKNTLEPWLFEYMASDLGIPEQDIENQINQLKMASADEISKFAQQMAARGMGASGLVGAGMGQIQSSTMAAMANVRFEAAKLAVEDRINRLKSYLALYGNMISTEAQVAMQAEINRLARDQFDYQQNQDRIADSWQQLANWASTNGAKGFGNLGSKSVLSLVWDRLHTINPETGEYYTWEDIVPILTVYTVTEDGVPVKYVGLSQHPGAFDDAKYV